MQVVTQEYKKLKTISPKQADAAKDINLINQYALKELKAEDVFVFSVVLCDNELDRDFEKFADSALDELAPLFVGKTGIFNHSWNAKDQVARIYKTVVETTGETNSLNEPLKQLLAFAYILRNESMKETIEKVEGGILKEVSVGVAMKESLCSVCNSKMRWRECEEGHTKGTETKSGVCYGILQYPIDAYEFSFVAVPAQRGAGVTKSFDENLEIQWNEILTALDATDSMDFVKKISNDVAKSLMNAEEKNKRQQIVADNKKFLKNQEEKK